MAAVAPASVAPDRNDEYYKSDEEYVFAVADALHEEYKAIIDAGLILQVDDAYLALTYEVMVPPKTLKDYRKWASAPHRGAQPRAQGTAGGAHPLSRVLG